MYMILCILATTFSFRYFVSYIIQFQFYESLCRESGHTGELYKCDFNGSTAAGEKLGCVEKLLHIGVSETQTCFLNPRQKHAQAGI